MSTLSVGRRVLLLVLAVVLVAAVVVPVVLLTRGSKFSLGQGNQLDVDCSSELSVTVQGKHATVSCGAPGTLAVQSGQIASQPAPAQSAPANGATSAAPAAEAPAGSKPIYDDAMASGWANWSWGSNIDFESQSGHSGKAIEITYNDGWSALYLHNDAGVNTNGYESVRFWLNGGSNGGQLVRVCAKVKCDQASDQLTVPANTWTQFDVPLSKLGASSRMDEFVVQNFTPGSQATMFIDDITLIKSGAASGEAPAASGGDTAAAASGQGPALTVDAAAGQRAISPLIYGINFPSEALAKELKLPVARWGGNATTRYNWQNDTSNRASDWFFENIPNDNTNPSALPKGSASDSFVNQNKRTATASIITVPMIGWTPKSRETACAFAVATFANQQKIDPYRPCGNGLDQDGKPIAGNDPKATSSAIGPEFVSDWITYLKGEFGTAKDGGVAFYNLDNEPSLWNQTHRDVRPEALGYDELRDLTYRYGAAIKAADPSAQTLGPVEWGWTGYFFSAKDQADGGSWWNNSPDRKAHGDTELSAWYLQQMRDYEQKNGVRILDYFDLHYYPQGTGVALQGAGDEPTQALRLRSTRSLWDANYADESWIKEPVKLIPRMREWVEQNYPGTKLAMTEYNWGGLETINGALAQADVLGIFGREGLDLATLWAMTANTDPGAFAFRMYRNYDGAGAQFGETSLQATSADQDKLSVYAAKRASDNVLTVMVINKTGAELASTLALQNAPEAKQAHIFQYTAADTTKIVKADDAAVGNGAITHTFPANSITLLEVR